jgi:putative membrane protein
MLIEIIIAMACGIMIGTFTGIAPGIHVNLVATTMLALSPWLLQYFPPLSLAVFLMSLAVTHSFLDTVPSTFLGAPNDENALSVLPAQKMLLRGEGYQAVKLTILGTYLGLIAAITMIPIFLFVSKSVYSLLKPYLLFLLIGIVIYMLAREKDKLWSALLFILSGTLGIITLSMVGLSEPLFPLLSGLFGVSGLMISYFENTKVPDQKFREEIPVEKKEIAKTLSASTMAVFIIQFFPGLGPSQGAVLSTQLFRNIKDKTYLLLVGAMGTMSVVFSLVTFFSLGNAKDGSIVVMSKIIEIDTLSFLILISAFLTAGSISVFLTLYLSKKFSRLIVHVNYKALIISIILFVAILALVLDGIIGVLILITATAIGLIAPLKEIPRNHAMGCLLLPVLLSLALG